VLGDASHPVDTKRIIVKKWRAVEEDRHKGSLTKKESHLVTLLGSS
jgi:hypothetical protein